MPRIINGNAASLRPSKRNIVTNLFSGWLVVLLVVRPALRAIWGIQAAEQASQRL
jgi:hypothetical protein